MENVARRLPHLNFCRGAVVFLSFDYLNIVIIIDEAMSINKSIEPKIQYE